MNEIDRQVRAAAAYAERGWHMFAVRADKRPLGNCAKCRPGMCAGQDVCGCPQFCHGHYAATQDLDHIRAMLWRAAGVGGGGALALRTGERSGVFAIDAEGEDNDEYGCTGLEVLDDWDTWTAGEGRDPAPVLPDTLRAVSSGGGVHLLYRQTGPLGGKNRIFPNVDLKADGGYIVLPPAPGRRWLNWYRKEEGAGERGQVGGGRIAEPGDALLTFLAAVKGRSQGTGIGSGSGVLASFRSADCIPAGSRYEFTRDLVFHLRRSGRTWEDAVRVARGYWERYVQPPVAKYELPWSQVMYELERVWKRVAPEEPLDFVRAGWARRQITQITQAAQTTQQTGTTGGI